jgi:signal transduction histidine kinase
VFFPSRAKYKPTVEQLSEDLTLMTSPDELARSIEATVQRWLPCESVYFDLLPPPPELSGKPLDPDRLPAAPAAEVPSVQFLAATGGTELQLAAAFGGRQLGTLQVGAKPGGALYTSDDVDLLRTIVNQGALALAHAHAYQELERRRRQQADAWRGEREALVETVAAEIAHEIRYPINYFRSVFERTAHGDQLDSEDVDIGREEVDRLERLVSGLRRMSAHRLERRPLALVELCTRADVLLRDAMEGRQVEFQVPKDVAIRCDVDQVTQILVNLLSNALQASGRDGHIGVTWRSGDRPRLLVWDDGAGFVGDPSRLFAPWFTTKARGTGLGLAITHRLVRAHGWKISAQCADGLTTFTIELRPEDVHHLRDSSTSETSGGVGDANDSSSEVQVA